MGRVIVAISGGKGPAWCADWALRNFDKERVILYFNDTKWEHPDLYRFLDDLSAHFARPILFDSDGRDPEQLFYDKHALANDRMPFCSRVLKAERLQKFYKDGDTIIFGIGPDEAHRAVRIAEVYRGKAEKSGKWPKLLFPLISERVTRDQIDEFMVQAGIEQPLLYKLGFSHNNCSGGCVRAGKKQWMKLYQTLPEVYADRERVEREAMEFFGRRMTFLKDESLEEFRQRVDSGRLSAHYRDDDGGEVSECIGVCSTAS